MQDAVSRTRHLIDDLNFFGVFFASLMAFPAPTPFDDPYRPSSPADPPVVARTNHCPCCYQPRCDDVKDRGDLQASCTPSEHLCSLAPAITKCRLSQVLGSQNLESQTLGSQDLGLSFTHFTTWHGSYYGATPSLHILIFCSQVGKPGIGTRFLQGRVAQNPGLLNLPLPRLGFPDTSKAWIDIRGGLANFSLDLHSSPLLVGSSKARLHTVGCAR